MNKKVILVSLLVIFGLIFVSGCIGGSNNDEIGRDEAKDAANKKGISDEEADKMFDYMDKDNSGGLSEDEVRNAMKEAENMNN